MPEDLAARGLPTIGAVDHVYDFSGSIGGPILQDRLWFFSAHRWWGNSQFVPGLYYNKDTSAWTYAPDLTRPAVNDNDNRHNNVRFTWQAAEKHRINLSWDQEENCVCHVGLSGAASPEGVHRWNFGPPNYLLQATWSYPMTNRLLFEAGNTSLIFDYPTIPSEELPLGLDQISVLEATGYTVNGVVVPGGFRYRSSAGGWRYGHKISKQSNQKFAVSYVTGSHSLKVGMQIMEGWRHFYQEPNGSMDYVFSVGSPLSLTQYATPLLDDERLNASLGIYAQDQWTINRLTLNLGLRFDYLNAGVPETNLPAGLFVPARQFDAVELPAVLVGHQPADRRRVRPVRNWQDGGQVQHRPVRRRRGRGHRQRQSSRQRVRQRGDADLGGRQSRLRARLRSPQYAAERRVRRPRQPELRPQQSERVSIRLRSAGRVGQAELHVADAGRGPA